jgi:hypothetical protein
MASRMISNVIQKELIPIRTYALILMPSRMMSFVLKFTAEIMSAADLLIVIILLIASAWPRNEQWWPTHTHNLQISDDVLKHSFTYTHTPGSGSGVLKQNFIYLCSYPWPSE